MILSCSSICKSFGSDDILKNASFHIEEHEKAAIVGINGAGKSTLLKIITGELPADSGEVVISKGKTLGYLAQNQDLLSHRTIYDEMLEVKRPVIEMEERLRELEVSMKLADGEELEAMMDTYSRLSHQFDLINGYAWKSEIVGVLKGLGFPEEEFGKQISTLSGGQKTRVSLGKLLLTSPDIILLDEPTNHLDMSSIAWLENYLLNYKGSVIIVAHDRYFLDKIVTKVVELDNGKVRLEITGIPRGIPVFCPDLIFRQTPSGIRHPALEGGSHIPPGSGSRWLRSLPGRPLPGTHRRARCSRSPLPPVFLQSGPRPQGPKRQ